MSIIRLFNAGNTHVQVAELSGSSLRLLDTVATPEFRIADYASENMVAASVVPVLEREFRDAGAFIVNSQMPDCPVDLSRMKHPETLGADRLANAAALIFRARCLRCALISERRSILNSSIPIAGCAAERFCPDA